ncbi:MAG TPA: bifunctional proline dehydrogenase/L-glutamate gamma-semialdehyde dehydrogenase [Acidimicrobiia bacterium]|nr:bifunctional proline dehydrogenase/L-glutamate gamma-semialdehyde dehydrogenase [Acidimicrobiia bacterium]
MDDPRVEHAAATAEDLLRTAASGTTRGERRRAARLGRLLADPDGRELLFALTDEVLRAGDPERAVARLRALLRPGAPSALGVIDRAGLRLAALAGLATPRLVDRVVEERVRAETRGVILPASDPAFARHVARRARAGIELNVNVLGEAILGDGEADARLDAVCARLRRPDVRCVSVKISALCANLDQVAFDLSVERINERLRRLYRVAREQRPAKFVYLDMEEYRDLQLTVASFRQVLDEPEFLDLPAGIALQAYLPDSHAVLDELCTWAAARRARGGAWIKVRIVKGANLAMEHVEAELAGWEAAPYATKADVDASYKRMVDRAFDAAARHDLRVGVASHNLFDIAWALTLRDHRDLAETVEIEMLEGMAPAQARAVRARAGSLLLYTPVVAASDYVAAIAYLSRRLDENAAPENFLRSLFTITPGGPEWRKEQAKFAASVHARGTVATAARRTQDRRTEQRVFDPDVPFANEPDTDFTAAANREWIAAHLARDRPEPLPTPATTTDAIDDAVARARTAAREWAATSSAERRGLLTRAAEVMAANRGRTLAVMAYETDKTVREGDPEVSEAIDMARWAAVSTRTLDELASDGVHAHARGTVVVAAPWNFPYAIPANGVLGALAAGNAAILKPAPEAVATAVELVRHLHEAGIPPGALQLVRTHDDDAGRHLITHDDVDTVVLTGAYDTARLFQSWKPRLRLIAETSGKNALVVTGGADIDLAIKDLVRSAFGHAGQKCSAASLAILEAGVYDDARVLDRLADAVRSLRVGPAPDLATMTGPLVRPAADKLQRALTRLEPGERWLVEPRCLDAAGTLWSPGVKIGVRPGSFFHLTECFGPVLGVMRARDLDDALALQNAPEFGLTGGLHSLDPDEIAHWTEHVQVGNAYVNRHTTGAIVRRQPFGGWKHSAVGPGAKTGGPDDILRFVRFEGRAPHDVHDSFRQWWRTRFARAHDESGLHAERNELRYRPLPKVLLRAGAATGELQQAAEITGTAVEVTSDPDDVLAARIARSGAARLRVTAPVSAALARACNDANVVIDDTPATGHGRVELPRWLHEQAISSTRHRHGRVPG